MFASEKAMVRDPAERDLGERQIMLFRDGFDHLEGLEVRLVPVSAAIALGERLGPNS